MRFSRGFKKQYLRKFYTLIDCWGLEGAVDWLVKSADEELGKGKILVDPELKHNLEDGQLFYETFDGFRKFSSCSSLSAEVLKENIKQQHFDYYQQFYNVVRLGNHGKASAIGGMI